MAKRACILRNAVFLLWQGYNYFISFRKSVALKLAIFTILYFFFQGVMVCIFCIFLSSEFREALRKHWMKWRYGIVLDTVR